MNEFEKLAVELAAQSPAKKRKVGAVIVKDNQVIGQGYNCHPLNEPCEDENGVTKPEVIHAEVAAIHNAFDNGYGAKWLENATIYVTHQPCTDCMAQLLDVRITDVRVVSQFMKFDGAKLRLDLVPPSAIEAIGAVLTFGARKYKPNNWRLVDDPARYLAALERHILAYKKGEKYDPESGLHHLAHAMTNLAFLIELDYMPQVLGQAKIVQD